MGVTSTPTSTGASPSCTSPGTALQTGSRGRADTIEECERCGVTTTPWRYAGGWCPVREAGRRVLSSSCGGVGSGRCVTWSRTGWRPGPGGSPAVCTASSGCRGRPRTTKDPCAPTRALAPAPATWSPNGRSGGWRPGAAWPLRPERVWAPASST
ncbi:MAG: methylenetetrahydrofolate reductase C-terminal domain-containing protein [Nocardioidaceae bacterium]|nr:methylenetetrahydrofolate reductase C-terminal domain-containing protein [Nocardioidaceae bacterium]